MRSSTLGQILAVFATLTHSFTALAAPPDPNERIARALVDESAKLLAQGRVPEACAKLDESRKVAPQHETDLKLGACWERAGRNASAWSLYLEVADAEQRAGHAAREREARAKAAAVEPRLARITIVVQRPEAVPGLEIRRDDVVVPPAQWNTAVPVDPGQHVVSAAAPGRMPFRAGVAASAGNVFFTLPELVSAAPPPPPQAVYVYQDSDEPRRSRRPKGERYSTPMMAGGIAMVVVGPLAMMVAAMSSINLFSSHQHLTPGAEAVICVGAVTTLAGIPLIVIGAQRGPAPAATLSIGPGSFAISGSF